MLSSVEPTNSERGQFSDQDNSKSEQLTKETFLKSLEQSLVTSGPDNDWVYKFINTEQPLVGYEQPSVPLINVFDEDFCPFNVFYSNNLLTEFIYYYVQYEREMDLRREVEIGCSHHAALDYDCLVNLAAYKFGKFDEL